MFATKDGYVERDLAGWYRQRQAFKLPAPWDGAAGRGGRYDAISTEYFQTDYDDIVTSRCVRGNEAGICGQEHKLLRKWKGTKDGDDFRWQCRNALVLLGKGDIDGKVWRSSALYLVFGAWQQRGLDPEVCEGYCSVRDRKSRRYGEIKSGGNEDSWRAGELEVTEKMGMRRSKHWGSF